MGIIPVLPKFIPPPRGVVTSLSPLTNAGAKAKSIANLAFRLPDIFSRITFGVFDASSVIKHKPFRETNKKNLWGIALPAFTPSGAAYWVSAFTMDSCVSIKFDRSATVSTFPVEQGSFANYNKVLSPNKVRVQLAVSNYGNGASSQRVAELHTQLRHAVQDATLFTIVTPDLIYKNYTVKDFDYARSSDKGLGLVIMDVDLVEVRIVEARYATVALPVAKLKVKTAATVKPGGEVQGEESFALTGEETFAELDARARRSVK